MLRKLPRRLAKRLAGRFTPTLGARELPGIPGRVHPSDPMLYDDSPESVENYRRAGRSALDNVTAALERAGGSFADVGSCLDFGCGYGRVLRLLCEVIPPERITAADVDPQAVRFCAAEFGVEPLVSSWKIAEIDLGRYDLIWAGSVFTHLDAGDCEALFTRLAGSLEPGGVLVFSLHGRYSREGLHHLYEGLYAPESEAIGREVAEVGLSFRPYDDPRFGVFPAPYGMTWHHEDYFEKLATRHFGDDLRTIFYEPQGWDGHHDVVAFARARAAADRAVVDSAAVAPAR